MIIPQLSEKYIDHIGFYENVFPEGLCQHIIENFDRVHENGHCGTRKSIENEKKYRKDDTFLFLNVNNHKGAFSNFNGASTKDLIQDGLQRCFDAYTNEYDTLQSMSLRSTCIKIQKTQPGQGYHIWHCEQGNPDPNRCLVWAIYLNDIEEAGETEFLYQKIRIPPKENAAIIWPAAFTHTHRGNVVHGNKSKYIITGWFYLE